MFWKGPGIFAHKDGDIFPGDKIPEGSVTQKMKDQGQVVELMPTAGQSADSTDSIKSRLNDAVAEIANLTEKLTAAEATIVELTNALAVATEPTTVPQTVAEGAGPRGPGRPSKGDK